MVGLSKTVSDSPLSKSSTNTHSTKLVLISRFTQAILCMHCSYFTMSPPSLCPTLSHDMTPKPTYPQHYISPNPVGSFGQSGVVFFRKTNPMGMKIILNYDFISGAAIKQINCHARRAKNIPVSFLMSSSSRYRQHLCDEAVTRTASRSPSIFILENLQSRRPLLKRL